MNKFIQALFSSLALAVVVSGSATYCTTCATESFDYVNAFRDSKGKNSLSWGDKLKVLANEHNKTMYKSNDFSHLDLYRENIVSAE